MAEYAPPNASSLESIVSLVKNIPGSVYMSGKALPDAICNHSFRSTGITEALTNGATLEEAQRLANHADIRTTKLYGRRSDNVTVEMVELVRI